MVLLFAAELGALAALTGFIFVAISINLRYILSRKDLPSRAVEALIAPVGAITATSLVLIPGREALTTGSGIIVAIGAAVVIALILIQVRFLSIWKENAVVTPEKQFGREAISAAVGVPIGLGGLLLLVKEPAGFYWVAAGDMICVIAIVLSAWVLMMEIMRVGE